MDLGSATQSKPDHSLELEGTTTFASFPAQTYQYKLLLCNEELRVCFEDCATKKQWCSRSLPLADYVSGKPVASASAYVSCFHLLLSKNIEGVSDCGYARSLGIDQWGTLLLKISMPPQLLKQSTYTFSLEPISRERIDILESSVRALEGKADAVSRLESSSQQLREEVMAMREEFFKELQAVREDSKTRLAKAEASITQLQLELAKREQESQAIREDSNSRLAEAEACINKLQRELNEREQDRQGTSSQDKESQLRLETVVFKPQVHTLQQDAEGTAPNPQGGLEADKKTVLRVEASEFTPLTTKRDTIEAGVDADALVGKMVQAMHQSTERDGSNSPLHLEARSTTVRSFLVHWDQVDEGYHINGADGHIRNLVGIYQVEITMFCATVDVTCIELMKCGVCVKCARYPRTSNYASIHLACLVNLTQGDTLSIQCNCTGAVTQISLDRAD